LPDDGLIL